MKSFLPTILIIFGLAVAGIAAGPSAYHYATNTRPAASKPTSASPAVIAFVAAYKQAVAKGDANEALRLLQNFFPTASLADQHYIYENLPELRALGQQEASEPTSNSPGNSSGWSIQSSTPVSAANAQNINPPSYQSYQAAPAAAVPARNQSLQPVSYVGTHVNRHASTPVRTYAAGGAVSANGVSVTTSGVVRTNSVLAERYEAEHHASYSSQSSSQPSSQSSSQSSSHTAHRGR